MILTSFLSPSYNYWRAYWNEHALYNLLQLGSLCSVSEVIIGKVAICIQIFLAIVAKVVWEPVVDQNMQLNFL